MSYRPVSRVLCQTITSPPDQLGWIPELSGDLQSTERGENEGGVRCGSEAVRTEGRETDRQQWNVG